MGLCDFENKDFCDWTNVDNIDDFDWLIKTGPLDIPGTGPSVDQTTGTSDGTFIYIRGTSPALEGWKARLYSEPILDTRPGCLYFWFHLYGSVRILFLLLLIHFINYFSKLGHWYSFNKC